MVKKTRPIFLTAIILGLLIAGCSGKTVISSRSSGNPDYEKQKIVITGDIEDGKEITVAQMRQLPQKQIECSFQRTTGKMESFSAAGPTLKDVLTKLGIDASKYKGMGFVGKDGYYCLIPPEIIQNRELILALAINDKLELARDMRPARLCAQGEFGPYWVRMVGEIILYKEIPQKEIGSVWVFTNLVTGIAPYRYEYYGSKDDAIELAQIFSRFDNVSSRAFFTMKSADGFIKNEALNMVSKDYYIKVAGKDAPVNMAPNIKLGMNVKNIAWFSTNADAVVFPEKMQELIGEKRLACHKGVALADMLEEVQVRDIGAKQFELIGVDGENVRVSGKDLTRGLLAVGPKGQHSVVWQPGTDLSGINNLLRIRVVGN